MSRPTPLSGFPELLPAERNAELAILDRLRRIFELHGYANVETRAVEPLERLLSKGEIDKEVYVLRRLHADESDEGGRQLGLHYDLTVPFARYVLENAVLVNPLQYDGYPSIGCWPCTRRVAPGDDPRSGRWAGTGKTECGIHR